MGNKKNEDQIEINDVVEDNGKVQKNISKLEKKERLIAELKNKKQMESAEQGKTEVKEELSEAEKVQKIVKKAKENGKITYGELAKELEDTNPEQIDKVFDAFEEMGVNL